ncbi:MAG: hypothetical protein IJD89_00525 [Clostridia bacterium]|nr:hypothetical protein [Clostridia bacterium]
MNNTRFNPKNSAISIIARCTENFMSTSDYHPDSEHDLYEVMVEHCSYILTRDFLDKKYTPMQYNDIRNEVSSLLFDCFIEHL